RYKPSKPIGIAALATHHILDEELIDCPPSRTFRLPEGLQYLIGHNIDFDWAVVGSPDVKRICTLSLARKIWPELEAHNQSALLYFLDRSNAKQRLRAAHSAGADIQICATILEHICKKLQINSLETLWQQSEVSRIPTHMPFGKHKGLPIAEVPKDYVRWLLGQPDVDPHLRKALSGG
ncbi:MAG: putative quorum-sensing-regulated virulence factor, partial [Burkholderiaceae bacterium]